MEKLQLSARAYDRILKVARTAADLGGKENIGIFQKKYILEVWIEKVGADRNETTIKVIDHQIKN
jgi:hypothetical protein